MLLHGAGATSPGCRRVELGGPTDSGGLEVLRGRRNYFLLRGTAMEEGKREEEGEGCSQHRGISRMLSFNLKSAS